MRQLIWLAAKRLLPCKLIRLADYSGWLVQLVWLAGRLWSLLLALKQHGLRSAALTTARLLLNFLDHLLRLRTALAPLLLQLR